jgi:hypothetical protein
MRDGYAHSPRKRGVNNGCAKTDYRIQIKTSKGPFKEGMQMMQNTSAYLQ